MATASGSGTVSTARVDKQIKIIKPIVYGNTAYALPQKLPNGHTHKWRLYIRPYIHSDDLSKYIRKVQFKLHESYPNPIRVTDLTPFELEETGWGEFEAQIKIYFADVNEKPVTAFYYIRLFQPVVQLPDGVYIVQKEMYDELIFLEPTETMHKALMQSNPKVQLDATLEQARRILLERYTTANTEILAEINDLKESLRLAYEFLNTNKQLLDAEDSVERMT